MQGRAHFTLLPLLAIGISGPVRRVQILDADTLERIGRLERRHPGVRAIALSPDGKSLAGGAYRR